ncbi:hypothetical protein CTI12_AA374090 [Artemisia annua]|uniref:Uncharacterized protein n=1 Tax=Artemisia annua TaxID=35608 RepID=A0A2U1MJ12_ARTAN|nr:hypothetical protein CTI12_AA374090 [Artemisia annua]
MDGVMIGPHPEEGENLNTGVEGTGRTPPGGHSAPSGPAQEGPSPAYVKENIDVLRTMIKELDNKGKEKATPRKLSYGGSRSAESENSQKSPSMGEAGGYSSERSSKSGRSRSQSARRHRKSVSRRRASSKSHRSDKSEGRSRSRTKSVKSKSRSARASRRKSSSESGYDTVSEDSSEDLSMPYKRPKPMPFTSRITRFRETPRECRQIEEAQCSSRNARVSGSSLRQKTSGTTGPGGSSVSGEQQPREEELYPRSRESSDGGRHSSVVKSKGRSDPRT